MSLMNAYAFCKNVPPFLQNVVETLAVLVLPKSRPNPQAISPDKTCNKSCHDSCGKARRVFRHIQDNDDTQHVNRKGQ